MTATETQLGKIWYLQKVDLFKGMSKEEMMNLARMVQERSFRKKEIIYLAGEPGNHVYLLKKGIVKISKVTGNGRELTLALLKPGEIFGELEAVGGEGTRDGQAEAHSDVFICVLNRNDLMSMMKSKPDLSIRLSKLIGFRRRVIENRMENLLFKSIPERLSALLAELLSQFGEKTTGGMKINIPLTHEDLANLIGAARATVTETLNEFKKQGTIEINGKLITVKRPEDLTLPLNPSHSRTH